MCGLKNTLLKRQYMKLSPHSATTLLKGGMYEVKLPTTSPKVNSDINVEGSQM